MKEGAPSPLVVQARAFSGPLPPPEDLAAYERSLPGAAERIFAFAEREQARRHSDERAQQRERFIPLLIGQASAFGLSLTAMVLGYRLTVAGRDLSGFTLLLTPLVSLVGVLLWRRKA